MLATSAVTQSAIVMQFVASSPEVQIRDQNGQAMNGVRVIFSAGAVASDAFTSGDGRASQAWRLGAVAGPQLMVVTVPGWPISAIAFTATALADTAAAISASSVSLQVALALSPAPFRKLLAGFGLQILLPALYQ